MIPCSIILVRPETSKNIGAVCRAMANFDCTDLRIIGSKKDYNDEEILRLAIHASPIWHSTQFFEPTVKGLQEALEKTSLVAGITRRIGEKRKSWGMTPEQFASFCDVQKTDNFALVFGNERTGLTDEELLCCSLAINIPSSPSFPSLNLSHAVSLICYTLFRSYSQRSYGYQKIPMQRIKVLAENINENINALGLFKRNGKEENEIFLRDIIARAGLSLKESRRLENLFKKIRYIKK